MQKENPLNYLFLEDEPVNYRASIEKYLFLWKWFALGVIMALLAAYIYLRYTPDQYEVNAAILIADEDKGGGIASELEAFKDMGLMGDSKTSIDTEIDVLTTRTLMQRVVKELGINDPMLEIAKKLEEVALNDDYFKSRNLYPNVDFYSGIIYKAIGFPTEMFTVLFALGRMPGWVAQWKEMMTAGQPIGRPRQIYTGANERNYVSLEKRG